MGSTSAWTKPAPPQVPRNSLRGLHQQIRLGEEDPGPAHVPAREQPVRLPPDVRGVGEAIDGQEGVGERGDTQVGVRHQAAETEGEGVAEGALDVPAVALLAVGGVADEEVSGDPHEGGAEAGAVPDQLPSVLLGGVGVGPGGAPHEGVVLDVAQPEGEVQPAAEQVKLLVREPDAEPVLAGDDVVPGLVGQRGQGRAGGHVAEADRGEERSGGEARAQVGDHQDVAPARPLRGGGAEDGPARREPHVQPARERDGAVEDAGRRLDLLGALSPERGEDDLRLRPAVLGEQAESRGLHVAAAAVGVAVLDHPRVGPGRRARERQADEQSESQELQAPAEARSQARSAVKVALASTSGCTVIPK